MIKRGAGVPRAFALAMSIVAIVTVPASSAGVVRILPTAPQPRGAPGNDELLGASGSDPGARALVIGVIAVAFTTAAQLTPYHWLD